VSNNPIRALGLDKIAVAIAFSGFFVAGFFAAAPQFGRDLRAHGVGLPEALIVPGDLVGSLWPFSGNVAQGLVGPNALSYAFHWPEHKVVTVAVGDTEGLVHEFDRLGYELDGDDDSGGLPVPRVLVASLPPDLNDLNDIEQHKSLFFQVMLPLVLQANELIRDQRARLETISDEVAAGGTMSAADRSWLDGLESYYDVDTDDFSKLMKRVDVVPVSLALAQAAIESGWGTSRFAVQGNAIFGQYTTGSTGLTPVALTDSDVRIHTYGGLFDAVMSYMRNLNTHPAYDGFRALREHERRELGGLDPMALAGALTRYSVRGDDYVRDVRRTIRGNQLDDLDNAWLIDGRITRIVFDNT